MVYLRNERNQLLIFVAKPNFVLKGLDLYLKVTKKMFLTLVQAKFIKLISIYIQVLFVFISINSSRHVAVFTTNRNTVDVFFWSKFDSNLLNRYSRYADKYTIHPSMAYINPKLSDISCQICI